MEVHRNYLDLNELASSIARIANNLDRITEIMTIESVARPLPDYDPEILRKEIEDLKLENDRLKKRNELMEDYIHALACIESKKSKFQGLCDNVSCPYYDHDRGVFEGACQLGSRQLIEKEAADLIDKLEDL